MAIYRNSSKQCYHYSNSVFDEGDVLYSKLRPYLRKVVLAPFSGVCSADMYPIKVDKSQLEPQFLAWTLLAEEFTTYAIEQSQRSRMPKLNREQLFSWSIPLPSLTIQRQIIKALATQIEYTDDLKIRISDQASALGQLPAALLQRAFSGEVSTRSITPTVPAMLTLPTRLHSKVNVDERAAVLAYIVNYTQHKKDRYRTILAKDLYLVEAFAGVTLNGEYERQAAGPLATDLYQLEDLAKQRRWFTMHRQKGGKNSTVWNYNPGTRVAESIELATSTMGDSSTKVDNVLDILMSQNTWHTEMIATLYAAWNDLLLDEVQPSDEQIIREVRENWHPNKEKFSPQVLMAKITGVDYRMESGKIPA